MLASLKIENVAIIEKAAVEFGYGLNVITGETGAGKSIVIDSINAILGERTSRELIRTGADSAKVYAVFEDTDKSITDFLDENGIDYDNNEIIISRVINKDGKNSCRVNGCPVTVSMLKSIGRLLIDIHGQHDNQLLLSPESHITFVDRYAECENAIEEYKEHFQKLCDIRKTLKSYNIDESEKSRRIDLLTYQIDELEKADIRIGETDELNEKKILFNNSQKVIDNLNAAYEALKMEQGGIDCIGSASAELDKAAVYLESVHDSAQKIAEMRYELEDVADLIRNSLSELDYDANELEEIEERLDLIYKLSRKYGETEEEMLAYLQNAKDELENISLSSEKLESLKKLEIQQYNITYTLASNLSKLRIEAGEKLSSAICHELNELDMPNVTFKLSRTETELTENGIDEIEFLISANAGESPKPLAKIASGGELSRIMLAIKTVLSDSDSVGTMIFDEIDTGVSGSAAEKIAIKLREVSKGKQVVCVTHLAQIAARGDIHLYISKFVHDGKTYTKIDSLTDDDRVREVARIMGGITITDIQIANAREMISNAEKS